MLHPFIAAVVADTPRSYYRLGPGTAPGTVVRDLIGSNHLVIGTPGTLVQSAGALNDNAEAALTFAGSSGIELVTSAPIANFDAEWAYECWMKFTSTNSNMFAVAEGQFANSGGSIGALMASGGKIGAFLRPGPSPVSTASFNDGLWHHAVLTFRGERIYVYVDGNEVVNVDGSSYATGTLNTFGIGARIIGANNYVNQFTGSIDEVAVYDHALTAARVSAHYVAGLAANPRDYASGPETTPGKAKPVDGSQVFYDDLTAGANETLAAHAPNVGTSWTRNPDTTTYPTSQEVRINETLVGAVNASTSSNTFSNYWCDDPGVDDYAVEATIGQPVPGVTANNTFHGVEICRQTDSDSAYRLYWNIGGTQDIGGWTFTKIVNGVADAVFGRIGGWASAAGVGGRKLRLERRGNLIVGTIDGAVVVEVVDTNPLPRGRPGTYARGVGRATWGLHMYDFKVVPVTKGRKQGYAGMAQERT